MARNLHRLPKRRLSGNENYSHQNARNSDGTLDICMQTLSLLLQEKGVGNNKASTWKRNDYLQINSKRIRVAYTTSNSFLHIRVWQQALNICNDRHFSLTRYCLKQRRLTSTLYIIFVTLQSMRKMGECLIYGIRIRLVIPQGQVI